MRDVKMNVLGREVFVAVLGDEGDDEALEYASSFVQGLLVRNQVRDRDAGIDPSDATHEVVKEEDGYHLRRFRFPGFNN